MKKIKEFMHDHAGWMTVGQAAIGITMAGFSIWAFIQAGSLLLAGLMLAWTIIAVSLQVYSGVTTQKVA